MLEANRNIGEAFAFYDVYGDSTPEMHYYTFAGGGDLATFGFWSFSNGTATLIGSGHGEEWIPTVDGELWAYFDALDYAGYAEYRPVVFLLS